MKNLVVMMFLVAVLGGTEVVVSSTEELVKALDTLRSGTTITLRGGNYHSEIALSGVDNITLQSAPGERAVLDGTLPITSAWTQYAGSVYRTKLNQPVWQLFIDDVQQTSARWPNAKYSDNSVFNQGTHWAVASSSTNGTLLCDSLPALDLAGAVVVLNSASFRSYAAGVLSTSGNNLTHDVVSSHKEGLFPFFIDAHLQLLDSEEEWYFNPSDSMLYVWGDPSGKAIRGKVQSYTLQVTNSASCTVRNLDFFATTLTFDRVTNGVIEGNRFAFPATNKRMLGETGSPEVLSVYKTGSTNFVFRGNIVEYTDGEALYTEGHEATVENNYFHTIDYTATSRRGLGVSLWLKGQNLRFIGNTLHTTGSSETVVTGTTPELSYNHMYNTGLVQNDGAVFQMTRNAVSSSRIHHNWIHDTPKYGIRFDAPADDPTVAGTKGQVHHNVLFNMPKAMMIKGNDHHIYNNTAFNSTGNDMILLDESGSNTFTKTFNNLVQKMAAHRTGSVISYPLAGVDSANYNGYVESATVLSYIPQWHTFNFTPNDAALIDAGVVLDGFPLNFMGSAPDLGAYEQGEVPWEAGITLDTVIRHPWPWSVQGQVATIIERRGQSTEPRTLQLTAGSLDISGDAQGVLNIYSLRGQKLFSVVVASPQRFNLATFGLGRGQYLLTFATAKGVESVSFMLP